MLTDVERHIAQALQAQLDELERISRARDDAEWRRIQARTTARLDELRTRDPNAYAELKAWLDIEIPLPPKAIRLLEEAAARDRIRQNARRPL